MTQRNPMNDRYTTDEVKGKTRKSAASAKPKTPAASTVYVEGKKSSAKSSGIFARAQRDANRKAAKKASKKSNKQETSRRIKPEYYNVPTEEYAHTRRLWWICISAAILSMIASYILQANFGSGYVPSLIILGFSYVSIFAAIYIDLVKTRRIRRAYQAQCEAALKTKEGRRIARENAKKQQEMMEAEEARRAAKRAARKERFSFKKKKNEEEQN